MQELQELVGDMYFDWDRLSSSGRETLDKISGLLDVTPDKDMKEAIDLIANELMSVCEEMHKSDKDMQEKIDTAWRLILNNLRHKGEK